MIAKGTIEEHILNIINRKRNLYEKLYNSELDLSESKDFLDNSSIIDDILNDIDKNKKQRNLKKTA